MLRIIALGFLLGTFLFHQLVALPSPGWLLACAGIAIPVVWFRHATTYFLCAFAIALSWAYLQSAWQLSQPLAETFYSKDIRVRGFIASLPEHEQFKQRFDFDVTEVLQPAQVIRPERLRLTWYHTTMTEVKAGQAWELVIRIKPVRNLANPGSFDYSAWLFQKGIRYTGYVVNHGNAKLISHSPGNYPVQQLRERIRSLFKLHLSHLEFEPILRALIIGDRSDVPSAAWLVMQRTGITHLMAISGLHIGLVAGFVFMWARYLWSRSAFLCLRLGAPRAAAITAILSAIAYAALAGFSLPTQRAVIMLMVIMGALYLERKSSHFDVLSIALLCVLIYDTHAVMSASFWLSFSAVGLILYILQIRQDKIKSIRFWLYMQLAISLGLLPLTILFFHQASLISPLANYLAIPVVTLLVIPAAMVGLILLLIHAQTASWIFFAANYLLMKLWAFLQWLSGFQFAAIIVPAPDAMVFGMALIGILIMLLPRVFRFRYLAIVFTLPLIFQQQWRPPPGEMRMTVLDVGQGLATVIETHSHVLVFDTGARFSDQFDLGSAAVIPYLIQSGHTNIDKMIVSHGDNDHRGGAESVLAYFPAQQLLTSVPAVFAAHTPTRCEAGMQWTWDDVHFHMLYPDASDYAQDLSENDLSCVLSITTRDKSFLITGDIEAEAERRLLNRYDDKMRSDVLLIPHHGSKTSSTQAFVDAVKPRYGLLPVGWRNRYRLPHASVVRRYQRAGTQLYSTAEHGALIIDSQTDHIQGYRAQATRFWQARSVE